MSWGSEYMRALVVLLVGSTVMACGSGSGTERPAKASVLLKSLGPSTSVTTLAQAEVKRIAQQYGAAKAAQNFGAIWDLMAVPSRRLSIAVSKSPAETDDSRARQQGFDSADHVKSLDDRSYFQARRGHLAKEGKYSYGAGVSVQDISVGTPVYVPFQGVRLFVYPATLKLTDGSTDLVGVTQHTGRLSIVEP